MKKSDIEKRLKSDLQSATPANFDAVWKRCERADVAVGGLRESATEKTLVVAGAQGGTRRIGGRSFGFAALALAFVLAVAIIFGAAAGLFGGGSWKMSKGYLLLDINPSVEIDYDETGNVTGVVGLNNDGKVLLYGLEDDLTGKTYEEVLATLFDRCIQLGYFSADYDTNAVLVSATSTDKGALDKEMTELVRTWLSEKFVDKKICGVAIAGKENNSLKNEAAQYGVNIQKYELICEYLALAKALGEDVAIEESEYATISIRELYEEIEDLQEELDEWEIGDNVSDRIESIIENLGEDIRLDLEELEEYADEIENAKTFEECRACAENVKTALREIEKRYHEFGNEINGACREIDMAIENMEKSERDLKATVDDIFAWREEEYRGNVDKEAEEPDGGFAHWQNGKEQEMHGMDWKDFKDNWKNDRD